MSKALYDLARGPYLQSGDAEKRIAELKAAIARGEENPEDEDQEELAELTAFRNEVIVAFSAARWVNGMSFVHDSEWMRFAEQEAGGLYGKAVVDSGFFELDRWSDALLAGFSDFELGGFTFWTRT